MSSSKYIAGEAPIQMICDCELGYRLGVETADEAVNTEPASRVAWMAFFGGFLVASGVACVSHRPGPRQPTPRETRQILGWVRDALLCLKLDPEQRRVISQWIGELWQTPGSPWRPAFDAGQRAHAGVAKEDYEPAFDALADAIEEGPPLDPSTAPAGSLTEKVATLLERWTYEQSRWSKSAMSEEPEPVAEEAPTPAEHDEESDPANAGLFAMHEQALPICSLSQDLVADEVNASLEKRLAWMAFFGGYLYASAATTLGHATLSPDEQRSMIGWMAATLGQLGFGSDARFKLSLWFLETVKRRGPWDAACDAGQSAWVALANDSWEEAFGLVRTAIESAPPIDDTTAPAGSLARSAATAVEGWLLKDLTT